MAAATVLSATTHEFMCCATHTGPWEEPRPWEGFLEEAASDLGLKQ